MTEQGSALASARAQVAAVRDDPRGRLGLITRTYHGPTGSAPRHLPFRRAALSFMRWQERRGVLNPLDAPVPGSAWWRGVNERLLRDGCESVALAGGLAGDRSRARSPDRAVTAPGLEAVNEGSGEDLREPRLLELVRDGNPVYAWPFEKRHVWRSADMPLAGRILERATKPSEAGAR